MQQYTNGFGFSNREIFLGLDTIFHLNQKGNDKIVLEDTSLPTKMKEVMIKIAITRSLFFRIDCNNTSLKTEKRRSSGHCNTGFL